ADELDAGIGIQLFEIVGDVVEAFEGLSDVLRHLARRVKIGRYAKDVLRVGIQARALPGRRGRLLRVRPECPNREREEKNLNDVLDSKSHSESLLLARHSNARRLLYLLPPFRRQAVYVNRISRCFDLDHFILKMNSRDRQLRPISLQARMNRKSVGRRAKSKESVE